MQSLYKYSTVYRCAGRGDYDPWRALAAAVVQRAYKDAVNPKPLYRREPVVNLRREARKFLEEWASSNEAR